MFVLRARTRILKKISEQSCAFFFTLSPNKRYSVWGGEATVYHFLIAKIVNFVATEKIVKYLYETALNFV